IDHKLADVMSTYWANFIKTGDPNGKGLPGWEPYNVKNKVVMILGDTQQSQILPDAKRLDFLYSVMKTSSQL
ncbi:MAG: carboxylesterase family protein, partial [Chitinophagaceae bacterium]|nr:carboxylesterase family protein [Chitinophagaceae bacterium]